MNYKDLLDKLRQRWQETSQKRKIFIILVSAVILAGLIYSGQAFTRPSYAILLGDLEAKDAGDIVAQLESEKIPYQLTNQGKTILVPQDQVDALRIKLASEGLLTGMGQGYELFDKSKFGVTEFEQQVSYQRALQEELRRTITKVEGVDQARVHLVIPQKSVFLEDDGTASASVVIKLKPNARIKPEQVKGLSDLIVGSVEGLKTENVHIIDTEGNVLNDFLKDPSGATGTAEGFPSTVVEKQQQIRRAYEKELESRVQQMLAKVLGPNKAVAMVTADMDFNQQQTNTTEVIPGQVVSERSTKESGTDAGGGGGASATTQMPGQTITGVTSNSQGNFEKSDDIKNYQLGSRVASIIQAPGRVLRLSTAVVLDESVKNLDKTQMESIVSAAIGFNTQRGDQITLSTMTFDRSQLELAKELEVQTKQQNDNQLYMMVGAAAGAALILLLLVVLWIRRRRRKAQEARLTEAEGIPVQSLRAEEQEPGPKWDLPPAVDKQKELKDIAEQRPDDLASVLKVWLGE